MNDISITSTIKTYPKITAYHKIKDAILGKQYDLSLVFVGPTRAASLNQKYRNKSYTPNILSFPLTRHSGEIIICPLVANRESKNFNLSPRGYIAFLFIHGCLHLKGHDHGDTMEKLEHKYCKAFNIT